jgi:hypothetical protein
MSPVAEEAMKTGEFRSTVMAALDGHPGLPMQCWSRPATLATGMAGSSPAMTAGLAETFG